MKNCFMTGDGELGFGLTRELAERDLQLNKLRHDITLDTTGEFLKRREQLSPWLPKPNMLHMNEIGCLVYENGILYNTKTGIRLNVTRKGNAVFYYLAKLVGTDLSYTDIIVSARPELDRFFQNISPEFKPIEKAPYIMLKNKDNGFIPDVTYVMDSGYAIGIHGDIVGLKAVGDSMYYVTENEYDDPAIMILSYLGYRLDVVIYEGVIKYGKETN